LLPQVFKLRLRALRSTSSARTCGGGINPACHRLHGVLNWHREYDAQS
jgi:hypothetical protein